MSTPRAGAITTLVPSTTSAAVRSTENARALPLGTREVQLESGFWGDKQELNASVTLLAGYQELEKAGSVENFRIAAGLTEGSFRGMLFSDSDVYKWLEAVSWELGRRLSPELQDLLEETIEVIAAAQQPDGYLNCYYQLAAPDHKFANPQMGHELYCAGHLIQAAVANVRMTGAMKLLDVAIRFANYLENLFGPGGQPYLEGHPEIEMALVELYRTTGDEKYLRFACHLIDQRGRGLVGPVSFGSRYFQDHIPVRESSTITGHAVRALYLNTGVTDAYLETGDKSLLQAMERQWADMVGRKLYLTGGLGSRHRDEAFGDPYELPPDRAYTETCAAIGSIMWNWRMLLATGQGRFADLIERTLYNGFASGLSLDGRRFYYTNPLQIRSGQETESSQGPGSPAEREPWYACACCPPNIMRLIASLSHYVASFNDDGVQIHQYMSSTIRTPDTSKARNAIRVRTEYPWGGSIRIEILESQGQPWMLSLRFPEWSRSVTLAVNGSAVDAGSDNYGYVRLSRAWRAGDQIELDLDLPPRLTTPHPYIDAVRGCVAIERGPLVYAMEQIDLPQGVELANVHLPSEPGLRTEHRPELLRRVTTVQAEGVVRIPVSDKLYVRKDGLSESNRGQQEEQRVALAMIPYYTWGNRGTGPMRVWIPTA